MPIFSPGILSTFQRARNSQDKAASWGNSEGKFCQDQNRDLLLIAGVTLASYWPSLCLCLPGYALKIRRSISLLL